jgi:dihydroorotase
MPDGERSSRAGPPVVVIRGGTVVDETGERRADVAIRGGLVAAVGDDLGTPAGAWVLDAGGCLVSPGLVDLHTHLREPGGEEAECVETGARAAALGGFTAVTAMPNTDPAIDNAAVATEVLSLGAAAACRVDVAGAITVGRKGEKLAPFAELAALGVRMFTDDGSGVQDAGVMRRALEYARGVSAGGLGIVLAQHCEVEALFDGAAMNEGEWSSRLGVPGAPAEAEQLMVERDLALAALTGGRVHFLHLSTAGSARAVAAGKARGLSVTAEVAPHHLSLTEAELASFDPVFKVNPPLRTAADVLALRHACSDGTVDAVATDHAPHPPQCKDMPLEEAASGMVGLETALPLAIGALCRDEPRLSGGEAPRSGMTVRDVIGLMSWRPARVGLVSVDHGGDQGGPVAVGAPANLCVMDLSATWVVDPSRFASRSRNSPWSGEKLTGKVRHTVFRGEPVVVEGEAQR